MTRRIVEQWSAQKSCWEMFRCNWQSIDIVK